MLARRFGASRLSAIEDAVQAALLAAVETWPRAGAPADPPAWLFRVAYRKLVDQLRTESRRRDLAEDAPPSESPPAPDEPGLTGDVQDALLRMLFVCCDDAIPEGSQVALALRTLSGLDVREIAERLCLPEATLHKRLQRARDRLSEQGFEVRDLSMAALRARAPTVLAVLHAMFTEGWLSSRPHDPIRADLCVEALRLAVLLAEHPVGDRADAFALVASFHLHLARLPARREDEGGLLLLAEQDRSLFDRRHVEEGLRFLARSASGDVLSRYHAEAAIAAEHCLAESFSTTRWDRIASSYALLERLAPSPLHTLGRALAVAEAEGPAAGLAVVDGVSPPGWMSASYLWDAGLADLCRRAGQRERAERHRAAALAAAPSPHVRAALARRLAE